jgi:hypothetical protein
MWKIEKKKEKKRKGSNHLVARFQLLAHSHLRLCPMARLSLHRSVVPDLADHLGSHASLLVSSALMSVLG